MRDQKVLEKMQKLGVSPESRKHNLYCKNFVESLRNDYDNDLSYMEYRLILECLEQKKGLPLIPIEKLLEIDLIGGNDFTVGEDTLWYTIEAHSVLREMNLAPAELNEENDLHYRVLLTALLVMTEMECKNLGN